MHILSSGVFVGDSLSAAGLSGIDSFFSGGLGADFEALCSFKAASNMGNSAGL